MFLAKLNTAAACSLVGAITCTGAWTAISRTWAQEALLPQAALALREKQTDKKIQAGAPGTLLLAHQSGLVALTPDGKERAELTSPKGTRLVLEGRLSPDGTQAAYIVVTDDGAVRPPRRVGDPPQQPWPFKVVIRKLGSIQPSSIMDAPAHELMLVWAPDGKRLLVTKVTWPDDGLASFETILLDPKTGKSEALELPAKVRILDWSNDGKMFLVVWRHEKKYRLGLLAPGDKEVRELTELNSLGSNIGRLSPDGTKVLYTDADPADKEAHRWGMSTKLYMTDVAAKKREPVAEFPLNAQAIGVTWSPDGRRIAYTWMQVHRELLKKKSLNANDSKTITEAFLMVADSDGNNAKTVSSGRCDNMFKPIFGSIDWR